jgi:hypothetical protein
MNDHLDGWIKEEVKTYILKKLNGADGHTNLFSEGALEAIINATNGIPQMTNKLCNAWLLLGHNQNVTDINTDVVMMAVNETELSWLCYHIHWYKQIVEKNPKFLQELGFFSILIKI